MSDSDARISRRTRRIGLIGLPNSGKTSWQYSLLKGGTKIYRGTVGWVAREVSRRFNEVGDKEAGDPQEATAAETFIEADLVDVERRPEMGRNSGWMASCLSILSRLPRRAGVVRLRIPEVSGETVLRIARGEDLGDGPGKPAMSRYLDFLSRCDTIVGFAAIDGGDELDSSCLDEVLLASMNRFEAILGEIAKRRGTGRGPVVVTILFTKFDLLRGRPALDEVRLPREVSAVARHPEFESLGTRVSDGDDGTIVFRVSEVVVADAAVSDMSLQDAIVADFLRRHAPLTAEHLAKFGGMGRWDLRYAFSAPYGHSSVNNENRSVFPRESEIERVMVWEPVADALERSWRHRSARRLRRWALATAAGSVAVVLLGPVWMMLLEARFTEAVESKSPWERCESALVRMDRHWFCPVESIFAGEAGARRAAAYERVRRRMREEGLPEDSPEIQRVNRIIQAADPSAVVDGDAISEMVAKQDRERVVRFLSGAPNVTLGQTQLSADAVAEICRIVSRLIDRPPAGVAWRDLSDRAAAVMGAMVAPVSARDRVACGGNGAVFRATLEMFKARADAQAAQVEFAAGAVTPSRDDARRVLDDASVGRWLAGARAIDDLLVARTQADLDTMSLEELMVSPHRYEWLDHLRRAAARAEFEQWLVELGGDVRLGGQTDVATSSWFATGDVGVERALERTWPSSIEELTGVADAIGDKAAWLGVVAASRSNPVDLASIRSVRSALETVRDRGKAIDRLLDARDSNDERRELSGLMQAFSGNDGVSIGINGVELDLSPVLRAQRVLAAAMARERMAWRPDRHSSANSAVARDAWVRLMGPLADETALDGVHALWEGMSLGAVDSGAIRSALESILEDKVVRESLGGVAAVACAMSPNAEALFEAALSATPTEAAVDFLEAFGEAMTAKSWGKLIEAEPVELPERLRNAGLSDEWIAGVALPAVFAAGLDPSGTVSIDAPQAFAAALGRFAEASVVDQSPAWGQLREAITQHWLDATDSVELTDPSSRGARAMSIAGRCVSEEAAPLWFARWIERLADHREQISRWDLVKVRWGEGRDDQCWLAREEWTVDDVRVLAVEHPEKWLAATSEGLPFDVEGRRLGKGPPLESKSSMRLSSAEMAARLVEVAGLRLPSLLEWEAARDSMSPHPKWDPGKLSSRWGSDAKELRRLGDVGANDIVGLQFGVREWVSDRVEPRGFSNVHPEGVIPIGQYRWDVGVRPALSSLPETGESGETR